MINNNLEGETTIVCLERNENGFFWGPLNGGHGIRKSHNEMAYFRDEKAARKWLATMINLQEEIK